MSTQGSSKKARVETSADECQDFKLHLANVPSFALGETHVGKPVYVCKQSDLIISVTKCMIEKRVSSVPVLTEKHNMYYGWIDWVPIVEYVIDHFTKEKANAPEGTAVDQTKTALEMMQESAHFKSLTVHDVMKYPRTNKNPFHPIRSCYSAFTVVEALAKDPQLQRVAIVNDDRSVANIVTQSDVLDYLSKRLDLISDGKKAKTLNSCKNLMFLPFYHQKSNQDV
mmetsp:Transcript_8804/g.11510  ORF Transcript_8804/g.11510 Transcript_8804/m.11510 type:complete len:226 (-) Transcript_8804:690-1367(-)